MKPKSSRWQELIKIKSEINGMETKEAIRTINESKIWFIEKTNMISRPIQNMGYEFEQRTLKRRHKSG